MRHVCGIRRRLNIVGLTNSGKVIPTLNSRRGNRYYVVTETFKSDGDTAEILHNEDLLKKHNGNKSALIKAALKAYANPSFADEKRVSKAKNVRVVA